MARYRRIRRSLKRLLLVVIGFWSGAAWSFGCLPIYGNWCGTGHPVQGTFPPPVDRFDEACMHHDLCLAGAADEQICDVLFVRQLHTLALRYGYLPRSLQWAEYVIRVKAGGPWGGGPGITPGDLWGVLGSLAAPCR